MNVMSVGETPSGTFGSALAPEKPVTAASPRWTMGPSAKEGLAMRKKKSAMKPQRRVRWKTEAITWVI